MEIIASANCWDEAYQSFSKEKSCCHIANSLHYSPKNDPNLVKQNSISSDTEIAGRHTRANFIKKFAIFSDLCLRQAIDREVVCAVLPQTSENTLEIQNDELTNLINELFSLFKPPQYY
ncbi:hypothetical protein RF11_10365 [Thelohanellus kitauei]|uniref:Uncharacterized protein n=1 Tax=Thelohanellus kitauei TaxID=669202 RepID=A0A0C2JPG6_THEKT|nr:hypothetical protein RF11_10365 [Thelohanellus kitauei]